jgi:hypothetical protein
MYTWHMGNSRWYISYLHLVTIWMYVVVSLTRIGQVAASSQQKECKPNFTVMWSLGIECKIITWTQINCLSSGSGWLLLLPYALLALEFKEWQWESFTGALYSNHHLSMISLLQIVFLFLVLLQWQSRSTACQHPVKVNIRVTARLLARQKQLQNDHKLYTSVHGLNNSCYN